MDIRKFFGVPKAGGGGSKQSSNSGTKNETDEKVKNKLSNFQREQKDDSVRKSASKKDKVTDKSSKKPVSKLKSKGNSEENIIIDDSSDDDVVPCSLEAKSKSKKDSSAVATLKGQQRQLPQKKVENLSTKTNDTNESKKKKESVIVTEKESVRKSPRKKSAKDNENEKSAKENGKEKSAKENRKEKSVNENRKKSVNENRKEKSAKENGKEKSTKETLSHKKKQKQIFDEESPEVSIVEDTESEDDEEVIVSKRGSRNNRMGNKRRAKILDSDSEDEDNCLSVKTPQGKRKKKSNICVVHDSDEENIETPLDKFVKKKATPVEVQKSKKEVPQKRQVSVSDFFGTGSASASRVERPNTSDKRKSSEIAGRPEKAVVFEEEMHDDEDFLKVLDELDPPDAKKMKFSESPEKTSPPEATKNQGCLASKLASKMKAESSGGNITGTSIKMKDLSPSPKKRIYSPQKSPTTPKHAMTVTEEYSKESKTPPKKESTPTIKTSPKVSVTPKSKQGNEDDGFGTRSSSFRAFKMRGGPQSLGSKEIPEGAENCMEGLTFVITGVLDSIERDDAKSLVEKYGGKVTASISKKTSYVVVGREPGESKLAKARGLKVAQIDEDGLFDLMKTLPGKTSKYEIQAKEQIKKEKSVKIQKDSSPSSKTLGSFQFEKDKDKTTSDKSNFTKLKSSESEKVSNKPEPNHHGEINKAESLLWVDKHKPTSMKQIIGQQGDKSNANKLLHWIQAWHKNVIVKGLKASGNFFGKGGGDGAGFRAALLSGPPGIGKTTTATLVCKEASFSYVELNASDTRSKRSLKEVVAESLNNQTLVDFLGDESKRNQPTQRHCLIMDEVDGMAGNEDRGGLQELVQLIKASKIPIICICNDRNSMKMRTLSNYCFDLRFQRPRVEQIKGAMMTLAFREGLKVPAPAVQEIILASNHDIRQVIHNLSMWSAGQKTLTFDQVKADAEKAQKDFKLGPFDVCRKVFVSDEETRKMTIHDKSDLFFHDYSFAPLFVHENYVNIIPSRAEGNKSKHMACLAHTIDSLCDGDLVEKRIRTEGNWNLLPAQAMYSSVIPGEIMRGSFPQMTSFPSWLGKNSSRGKMDRILQELGTHMCLRISCDKRGLNQDYLPALRTCLTSPLVSHGTDGVPSILRTMNDYDIVKEDFDNILDVSKWPNSIDNMSHVESKTKAALTRMYNKNCHKTPYSTTTGGKKKRGGGSATPMDGDELLREEGEEEQAVVESEDEEDDVPAAVLKKQTKGKSSKGKTDGNKAKGKTDGSKAKGKTDGSKGKTDGSKGKGKGKKLP